MVFVQYIYKPVIFCLSFYSDQFSQCPALDRYPAILCCLHKKAAEDVFKTLVDWCVMIHNLRHLKT